MEARRARQNNGSRRRAGSTGRLAAAGGVAFLLLLVACGSEGDEIAAAETFRTQANAIFCDGSQEIHQAVSAMFGAAEPTPEMLQATLDTIVTSSNRQADDIDALAVPSSMESDVAAMLVELRHANQFAAAQGLSFFETDGDPWQTTNELAQLLGLDVCATS